MAQQLLSKISSHFFSILLSLSLLSLCESGVKSEKGIIHFENFTKRFFYGATTLSIPTFSITTLSIMGLVTTLRIMGLVTTLRIMGLVTTLIIMGLVTTLNITDSQHRHSA
jgi:hypothetical protein